MNQILVHTPANLSAAFYDGGEDIVDPGTVTVTITRADGTALATDAATTGTGAAARTYVLAAQDELDILTAVWSGAAGRKVTTKTEIVGGFIVSLADIRAQQNMADEARYTTARLSEARDWFTDLATDFCGFSPVPRLAVQTFDGTGTSRARLPLGHAYVRRLRWATIDGEAVAEDALADWGVQSGIVDTHGASTLTYGRGTVTVAYEHGLDGPPADLRNVALTAIRYRILTDVNQQMPDRVVSTTNDVGGTIQYARANKRYPTGIDDVDATLTRLRLVTIA